MPRKRLLAGAVALATGLGMTTEAYAVRGFGGDGGPPPLQQAELIGRSILPAETFRPGSDPSGFFTGITTPIPAPFPGQPVQGFSAVHAIGDGTYLVMSDNGYGSKANSEDFELRVHHIAPDVTTGKTTVLPGGFGLSDPDHEIPFTIWRDGGCAAATSLPAGYTCPAPDRVLTGSDFDIESFEIVPDGTFWFGDEFGPFLLHTDAHGRVLSAPVPTPGVVSPSNPTLVPGQVPNPANSKGFEGMALAPDGGTLYPMLEGPVAEDTAAGLPADLRIFQVRLDHDSSRARFTGKFFRYRLEFPTDSIGGLIAVNEHQLLVIERDQGAGPTARFKSVFLLDLRDRDGYVDKHLLVNLMAVPDPRGIGGFGPFFPFPFVTIESIAILDPNTVAILNDNNFPGTGGRAPDKADENEFIEIRLDQPLDVDHRVLPGG